MSGIARQASRPGGGRSRREAPEAEERSKRRPEADAKAPGDRPAIERTDRGATLDEWLAGAGDWDADRVVATSNGWSERSAPFRGGTRKSRSRSETHRAELARMDGGRTAADAQDEAEHLLAELRSKSEEFARLKLAGWFSVGRWNVSRVGPGTGVVEGVRAVRRPHVAIVFGAAPGLRRRHTRIARCASRNRGNGSCGGDERWDLRPTLPGVRLALLEPSLAGREPLPLIVDDILVLFDDERAMAALQVLADFSQDTGDFLHAPRPHRGTRRERFAPRFGQRCPVERRGEQSG